VNQVTSASLRYPLSVFNKNSTLKVHEAGFGESVYSSTLLATPLRRHRVSGCIEGGQVLQALASAVLALVMYALDLDVNDREDVVA